MIEIQMDYIAQSKNVKISPRKVRLVVDSLKKRNIEEALSILKVISKRASLPVRKTIESAIANAASAHKTKKEDLLIKGIVVNEGISYKRYHYAGRGRTRPYKKRTSHIKVILADKPNVEIPNEVKKSVKTRKEEKS